MSVVALARPSRPYISAYIQEFRQTRRLPSLIKALVLVFRQGRMLELIYGGYCRLVHRPMPVCRHRYNGAIIALLRERSAQVPYGILSRERLVERYGSRFKVRELPLDFQGARRESVWHDSERLIIGEYGEDCRIAYITRRSCNVSRYYREVRGVRHIHAIEWCGRAGEFLVSTGDTRKFLDLWRVAHGAPVFVRRLRSYLAGYTAMVQVRGQYYFGTDFSGRPNYIETMDGAKYFFPEQAYDKFVTAFEPHFDRYIVVISSELSVMGGNHSLSIFDTVTRSFILSECWAAQPSGSLRASAPYAPYAPFAS